MLNIGKHTSKHHLSNTYFRYVAVPHVPPGNVHNEVVVALPHSENREVNTIEHARTNVLVSRLVYVEQSMESWASGKCVIIL